MEAGGSGGKKERRGGRLLAFQQDEKRFLPAKHRLRVRLLHPFSWNAPKIDRVWGAILQPTVLLAFSPSERERGRESSGGFVSFGETAYETPRSIQLPRVARPNYVGPRGSPAR